MGRTTKSAWTTGDCLRIELSYLLKAGYLVRGEMISGTLSWSFGGSPSGIISIVSSWPKDPAKRINIRLIYTATNHATGQKDERDDTVYLEARLSNLGKGEVLYFICPDSGQRCRILYRGYGCPIWKSRAAYQHRIYYPSQQSSKMNYANNQYWELDKQIERLRGKRRAGTYRGQPTKRAERLERLRFKQKRADYLRFQPEAMTLGLRRAVFGGLPGYEDLKRKF